MNELKEKKVESKREKVLLRLKQNHLETVIRIIKAKEAEREALLTIDSEEQLQKRMKEIRREELQLD